MKIQKAANKVKEQVSFLESKWKRPVQYSCAICLDVAYNAVKDDVNGYITDDELIESSGNILRHK